ncbi:MAG: hypothetical protein HC884_09720 [Chloroflexaceae bacterium]|nr:hypothetical protein [Chloroflexaceae bacterium]
MRRDRAWEGSSVDRDNASGAILWTTTVMAYAIMLVVDAWDNRGVLDGVLELAL